MPLHRSEYLQAGMGDGLGQTPHRYEHTLDLDEPHDGSLSLKHTKTLADILDFLPTSALEKLQELDATQIESLTAILDAYGVYQETHQYVDDNVHIDEKRFHECLKENLSPKVKEFFDGIGEIEQKRFAEIISALGIVIIALLGLGMAATGKSNEALVFGVLTIVPILVGVAAHTSRKEQINKMVEFVLENNSAQAAQEIAESAQNFKQAVLACYTQ